MIQGIKKTKIKRSDIKNQIIGNELDPDLFKILKILQAGRDVKLLSKNYFNFTNKEFIKMGADCIFINPPFNSPRKQDKIYYEFLFHTFNIIKDTNADVIFICPPLFNNERKEGEYDVYNIFNKLSIKRRVELFNKYGFNIKPGDIKNDSDKYNEIIEDFFPWTFSKVGNISGFGGTGVTASVYYFQYQTNKNKMSGGNKYRMTGSGMNSRWVDFIKSKAKETGKSWNCAVCSYNKEYREKYGVKKDKKKSDKKEPIKKEKKKPEKKKIEDNERLKNEKNKKFKEGVLKFKKIDKDKLISDLRQLNIKDKLNLAKKPYTTAFINLLNDVKEKFYVIDNIINKYLRGSVIVNEEKGYINKQIKFFDNIEDKFNKLNDKFMKEEQDRKDRKDKKAKKEDKKKIEPEQKPEQKPKQNKINLIDELKITDDIIEDLKFEGKLGDFKKVIKDIKNVEDNIKNMKLNKKDEADLNKFYKVFISGFDNFINQKNIKKQIEQMENLKYKVISDDLGGLMDELLYQFNKLLKTII